LKTWLPALILSLPVFFVAPHATAAWDEALSKVQAYEAALAARNQATDPRQAQSLEREATAKLEEARVLFEDKGILRSQDRDGLAAYGQVLLTLGHADLAAETYERLVALAREDASVHLALARARRAIGPAGEAPAFEAVQEALYLAEAESPLWAEAMALQAALYWDAGLYAFAEESITQALPLLGDTIETQLYHAALMTRAGEVVEASALLDALGREAQAYDAKTRALLRTALWDFDKLRRTVPDTAAGHGAYARLLYRAARLPDAVLALRRALHLDANAVDNWNFLAAINTQLGNLEQAIAAYEQSLEKNRNQPQIQQQIEGLRNALTQNPNP